MTVEFPRWPPTRGVGVGAQVWTVRMVVRVPPEKQAEFFQSAYQLLGEEPGSLRARRMLRDLYDREVFCWMADAWTQEEINQFVESPGFHALRGAAEVLGGLIDFRVFSDHLPSGRPASHTGISGV
jgi:hypothetical protein